jgi:hypothetical protein
LLFLNFTNKKKAETRTDSNKKAELTSSSSFGSPAIFHLMRPAAFRPLLTKGLAFSRTKTKPPKRYSNLLGA